MTNSLAKYGAALALAGAAITAGVIATQQKDAQPSAAAPLTQAEIQADAARLAKQASFGPTPALVTHIAEVGPSAWLDEQFVATGSTYTTFTTSAYAKPNCDNATDITLCIQTYYRARPVAMRFYTDALSKPDQLRQRVALALSEMIVVSGLKVENAAGIASFQQILLSNAFGNYRDILQKVTLNAGMGDYLDMAGSKAAQPNQNYAREFLQIFSVYPSTLNLDGTLKLDASGNTIPTYTEQDVNEVSRALTGWTYARHGTTGVFDERKTNYAIPMVQYPASYNAFDKGAKSFLGYTVPANATPQKNVDTVVEAAFMHPNVGPYVSKQLIQHLVTANPKPEYVARVATVFNDNGSGVRGDLKAVVRAILLDPEARGPVKTDPDYGKVKEPILYITSFMRLMAATSDGWFPYAKAQEMNQRVFEAPSVFNFYPWDYPLAKNKGMVSPASKLLGGGLDYERHNFGYDYTLLDDFVGTGRDYRKIPELGATTGTKVNWAQWEAFGKNDEAMLARMNLLMLNNTMTKEQHDKLILAMSKVTDSNAKLQTRRRAQTALYIILTSPQFQVDR